MKTTDTYGNAGFIGPAKDLPNGARHADSRHLSQTTLIVMLAFVLDEKDTQRILYKSMPTCLLRSNTCPLFTQTHVNEMN